MHRGSTNNRSTPTTSTPSKPNSPASAPDSSQPSLEELITTHVEALRDDELWQQAVERENEDRDRLSRDRSGALTVSTHIDKGARQMLIEPTPNRDLVRYGLDEKGEGFVLVNTDILDLELSMELLGVLHFIWTKYSAVGQKPFDPTELGKLAPDDATLRQLEKLGHITITEPPK